MLSNLMGALGLEIQWILPTLFDGYIGVLWYLFGRGKKMVMDGVRRWVLRAINDGPVFNGG